MGNEEINKTETVNEIGDTVQTPPTETGNDTVTEQTDGQVVANVVEDGVKQEAKNDDGTADDSLTKMKDELKQRDEQIQELQKQLAEAMKIGENAESLTKSVNTLTTDLEKKQTVIGEYEGILQNIVESKMKNVPEQFKELIPTNMSLTEKLGWLEKAETTGLFVTKEKTNPQVEIGKPMNMESPKVEAEKLSASELMKMAYNTIRR